MSYSMLVALLKSISIFEVTSLDSPAGIIPPTYPSNFIISFPFLSFTWILNIFTSISLPVGFDIDVTSVEKFLSTFNEVFVNFNFPTSWSFTTSSFLDTNFITLVP